MVHIKHFEDIFSDKIFQRGKQLHKEISFNDTDIDNWANIELSLQGSGSRFYDLFISIDDQGYINHLDCNCPYDSEPYCKHLAAILIHLQNIWEKRSTILDQNILDIYPQLSVTTQRVLKVIALSLSEVTLEYIQHVLNDAGFKNQNRKIALKAIKSSINTLTEKSIIHKDFFDSFSTSYELIADLFEKYFQEDEEFSKIAKITTRMMINLGGRYFNTNDPHKEMLIGKHLDDWRIYSSGLFTLLEFEPDYVSKLNAIAEKELIPILEDVNNPPKQIGEVQSFLLHTLALYTKYLLLNSDKWLSRSIDLLPLVNKEVRSALAEELIQILILKGRWDSLSNLVEYLPDFYQEAIIGIRYLLVGKFNLSLSSFELAQKKLRKTTNNPKAQFTGFVGIFYILIQLKTKSYKDIKTLRKNIQTELKQAKSLESAYLSFLALTHYLDNNMSLAQNTLQKDSANELTRLFQILCTAWIHPESISIEEVEHAAQEADSNGYYWYAQQMQFIKNKLSHQEGATKTEDVFNLTDTIPYVPRWQITLEKLIALSSTSQAINAQESLYRIAWLVDFEQGVLQAKLQKRKDEGWTKGRQVSATRLTSELEEYLSEKDHKVIGAIEHYSGSQLYMSLNSEGWRHLVEHPALFQLDSKTQIRFELVNPTLKTYKVGKEYKLEFSPAIPENGTRIIKQSPTHYQYLSLPKSTLDIAKNIGHNGLSIPVEGEKHLEEALKNLSKIVPIQSNFSDLDLPTVEADPRICFHLLPSADSYQVELYCKPLGSVPPYFRPAEGSPNFTGLIDGQQVMCIRDLNLEKSQLQELKKALPILKKIKKGSLQLNDLKACLSFLLELKPLLDEEKIMLEWPRGELFKVSSTVGFDQFKLSIKDRGYWFELDGQINVDEQKVLKLQDLVRMADQDDPFVEITPGNFTAITDKLRKKLKTINGILVNQEKTNDFKIHPLAIPAIQDFTKQIKQIELPPIFSKKQKQIKEAFKKKFSVPDSFKAKLRPYQEEGYQWLQRCAYLGAGACLADDMGLGKTIQALALLSDRAHLGPSLVVAPASVVHNWQREAEKFTDNLDPILFGSDDRTEQMTKIKAGSLVLVTYDLMARESELLTSKEWNTIILDEAQAIKNRATKRSKVTMELKGKFKMVLTGTPVENHLGELWNLFEFINPGLLGTYKEFGERFILPIEKLKDKDKIAQLQKLIRPFILRRHKEKVLKELPPKTESILEVELSDQEKVFYEALRRNALQKLEEEPESNQGSQHLKILAAIMKLRRAACHPNLVTEGKSFSTSSKSTLFINTLQELLDNGHKIIVFSQFVDHLNILKSHIEKLNISYQYLDGQTSKKKRQTAIDNFQNGLSDVFLISLKAGGTGINLTNADYVIHTDPWWNPAVEDQATDRAHRIGQTRPVTVYRLITKNTIEEKILDLHAHKRELADSLLEGSNASAKLSADELMKLLKEK